MLNITFLGGLVQLRIKSMLLSEGWFNSFKTKKSVDANGNSIPWYTYSFIKFFESRLNKKISVFEYGCGGSTFWFSSKVKQICSVEHDIEWFKKFEGHKFSNVQICHQGLDENESYSKAISKFDLNFDVVVVDGKERNSCVINCLQKLTENGIVIIDNSDRIDYQTSFDLLKEKGFKRLDFWGMTPIIADISCTSVFYKNNNCLNI